MVVGAQSFHWFDQDLALPEIARVLQPGGHPRAGLERPRRAHPLGPRLGALIGTPGARTTTRPTPCSPHDLFGFVEEHDVPVLAAAGPQELRDLVASRSNIAVDVRRRARPQCCARSTRLYDEYGRGADGMLLPYVTHCFRAVVRPASRGRRADHPPTDRAHADGDRRTPNSSLSTSS